MELQESFFEDEIRNGHLVTTMLKRGWAATLETLEEIDRICNENDLKYYAYMDTLLGMAVNKGFLPWSDKIDICMMRDDYDKFINIAENKLPYGYRVTNIINKDGFRANYCMIKNAANVSVDTRFLDKYHGCPASVFVNVYALDCLAKDKRKQEQHGELIDFVMGLIVQYDDMDDIARVEQIEMLEEYLDIEVVLNDPENPVSFQLGKILEKLCGQHNEDEDTERIANMMDWRENGRSFDKIWFKKSLDGYLEGFKIAMPSGYLDLLESVYGDYKEKLISNAKMPFPHFEEEYIMGRENLGFSQYSPDYMKFPRKPVEHPRSIVFITQNEESFKEMLPVYRKVCRQFPECEIMVMPVPYYTKDVYGRRQDDYYYREISGVKTVAYDEISLATLHPDRIYFQNPCDGFHESISVSKDYYSDKLWGMTEELVHVPYRQMPAFDMEDVAAYKMLYHACRYPGLIHADRIEIDESKKSNYLSVLVYYSGEASLPVWSEKLRIGMDEEQEEN